MSYLKGKKMKRKSNLNEYQLRTNEMFLEQILEFTNDGGFYIIPNLNESYEIRNKKFFGTKKGIEKLKEITSTSFYSKFEVKQSNGSCVIVL